MQEIRISISGETLTKAVASGLLTQEIADQLRVLEATSPHTDDIEKWRLISGVGDVLVLFGIILFTGSVGLLFGHITAWVGLLGFTAATWGASEYFLKKQKMPLPKLLLSFLFSLGVFLIFFTKNWHQFKPINTWTDLPELSLSLFLTGIFSIFYYIRFKTTITPALILGTLCLGGYYHFTQITGSYKNIYTFYILPIVGIFTLIGAIRLDYMDQKRLTKIAETALWLHLLAAIVIVHPIMLWASPNLGANPGEKEILDAINNQAKIRSLFVVIISIVSLIIDRRAMIVSSIFYAMVSFTQLPKAYYFEYKGVVEALIFLTLGSLILILGLGWYRVRARLLRLLPKNIRHRLPRADILMPPAINRS